MKENRIFAGLWYGSEKPDMTLFLKPLCNALTKLYTDGKQNLSTQRVNEGQMHVELTLTHVVILIIVGVLVAPPGYGSSACRAALLACSCDLPARALVMNIMQFNGSTDAHTVFRQVRYYMCIASFFSKCIN